MFFISFSKLNRFQFLFILKISIILNYLDTIGLYFKNLYRRKFIIYLKIILYIIVFKKLFIFQNKFLLIQFLHILYLKKLVLFKILILSCNFWIQVQYYLSLELCSQIHQLYQLYYLYFHLNPEPFYHQVSISTRHQRCIYNNVIILFL